MLFYHQAKGPHDKLLLEKLQTEIVALKEKNAALNEKNAALEEQNVALQTEIAMLNKENAGVRIENSAIKSKINAVEVESKTPPSNQHIVFFRRCFFFPFVLDICSVCSVDPLFIFVGFVV